MTTLDVRSREHTQRLGAGKPVDRHLIWAGAAIVLGLAGCVTVLAAMGKDTNSLLVVVNVVVVPLLAAAGWGKLNGIAEKTENIRQQTNGTQSRLMDHALGTNPATPANDVTTELPRIPPESPRRN